MRDVFACSMPLRIASGTSCALPSPYPTCPFPSPATTTALKLKRRPPLTTLLTRLICTTFSLSSSPSELIRSVITATLLLLRTVTQLLALPLLRRAPDHDREIRSGQR